MSTVAVKGQTSRAGACRARPWSCLHSGSSLGLLLQLSHMLRFHDGVLAASFHNIAISLQLSRPKRQQLKQLKPAALLSRLGLCLQLFGPVEAPMYSLQYAGGGQMPPEAAAGSAVLAVQRLATYLDATSMVSPGCSYACCLRSGPCSGCWPL